MGEKALLQEQKAWVHPPQTWRLDLPEPPPQGEELAPGSAAPWSQGQHGHPVDVPLWVDHPRPGQVSDAQRCVCRMV